jgi:deoxyribodipyrimidine photo-lyase
MSKKIIIWFRNDLRSHDHQPLHQAVQLNAQIIPIYCFDPRTFGQTNCGFPKTGAFRAKFLLESLIDLRHKLKTLGSNLIIRQGFPELIIPELALDIQATDIYFHGEVTSEEIKVETDLINNLTKIGVKSVSFWGHSLYNPEDLPFQISNLPELFTSFRKEVEKSSIVNPPLPTPAQLPPIDNLEVGEIPTLGELGFEPAIADPRTIIKFTGGETSGLERLDYYFWQSDLIGTYKETRNGMLGEDYSSKFSPWLAFGCLSPRYIYAQVKKYEQERTANDSTYWLIFELLWRDYFRFIATKHGDRLFKRSGLQGINLPWSEDGGQFGLWQTGQTGFPLIDANMQELAATGFMSNRGRQNVASFLTKNMGINWQMGAEWFESMLIDYDVCSNWGNWNYAAGVGNDARGFRYFNILKQSQDYDPDGKYVKHWLPALKLVPSRKVHSPWTLLDVELERSQINIGKDYPKPILDLEHSVKVNEQAYNSACGIGKNAHKRENLRR